MKLMCWVCAQVSERATYGQDEVGHVAVAGDDLEPRHGVFVAHNVGDIAGPVLLHPWYVVG